MASVKVLSGSWSGLLIVCVCADKRGVDVKLSSAQALLHEQDESLRRGERERRALNERIQELERLCLSAEAERRRVEVRGRVHLRPRLHWQGNQISRSASGLAHMWR